MLSYILWTGLIALLISVFLLQIDQKIGLPRPYILVGSGICFVLSLCFPPALLFMDTTAALASILGAGLLLTFAAPQIIEKNLDRFKWLEKVTIPKTWSDRVNQARLQYSLTFMKTKTSAFLRTAAKAVLQFTAKTGASLTAVLKTTALALSRLIDKLKIEKLKAKVQKAEEPAVFSETISAYDTSPLIGTPSEPADESPAVPEMVVEETAVDAPALEEEAPALSEVAVSIETADTEADEPPAVPEMVAEETAVDTPALEEEAPALSEVAASIETADTKADEPSAVPEIVAEETTADAPAMTEEAQALSEAAASVETAAAEEAEEGEEPPSAWLLEEPASLSEDTGLTAETADDTELPTYPTAKAEEAADETPGQHQSYEQSGESFEPTADLRAAAEQAETEAEESVPEPEEEPAAVKEAEFDDTKAAGEHEGIEEITVEPTLTADREAASEKEAVSAVSVVDTTPDTAVDSGEIESGEVKTAEPGVESEPAEPTGFQSETDNYSGGVYMANENLIAASAPRERRPLGELINSGFDAKEQGRWEDAINFFRQALEINRHPDLSVLLVLEISCLYRDKGCYQPAVDVMQSFLNLYSGSLDKANLDKIKNEMFYIETVYGLLQQSGTPDLPSGKIPRLIKIKAEELYRQRKGMTV